LCDKEGEMGNNVEEIEADEHEEHLERVGAIDVAKASGKVCVRLPHRSVPGRSVTKVWDVAATTTAIMALADELAQLRIERVVLEATSDYWRPFFSAPRGALTYPPHSGEGLEVISLGSMADLDSKE